MSAEQQEQEFVDLRTVIDGHTVSRIAATYSYTVHINIGAVDDKHAIELSRLIKRIAEQAGFLPTSQSGYLIDSVQVTDADDWAEHIDVEAICAECHQPVDRERSGAGSRVHHACIRGPYQYPYPIEQVNV